MPAPPRNAAPTSDEAAMAGAASRSVVVVLSTVSEEAAEGSAATLHCLGCVWKKILDTTSSPSRSSSLSPRWYWCITQLVFSGRRCLPKLV
uniref:Uncharacterized protein n=1 Tax=Arundo donax TaxID=35708 RepID=A0A0A9GPK1_ARUDO